MCSGNRRRHVLGYFLQLFQLEKSHSLSFFSFSYLSSYLYHYFFRVKSKFGALAYLSPATRTLNPDSFQLSKVIFTHLSECFCTFVLKKIKNETFIFLPSGLVLPHQQEIERMSSFREQLGEDWLRYQHHLDQGSPSVTTQAPPSPLSNGLKSPEPLLPPKSEDEEQEADTESTLQWPGHDSQPAESTLENITGDAPLVATDEKSPGCVTVSLPGGSSLHPKGDEEEEEENLGGVEAWQENGPLDQPFLAGGVTRVLTHFFFFLLDREFEGGFQDL